MKEGGTMAKKTKQQEIDELKVQLEKANWLLEHKDRVITEMINQSDDLFANSGYCKQLEKDVKNYKTLYEDEQRKSENWKERYQDIQDKYRALYESDQKRKKAGRKPHNEAWTNQYQKFCEMIESGKSMDEVMQQLEISRATFFRLKKQWKEAAEIK